MKFNPHFPIIIINIGCSLMPLKSEKFEKFLPLSETSDRHHSLYEIVLFEKVQNER